MKRILTVSLALLLGLVSSQELSGDQIFLQSADELKQASSTYDKIRKANNFISEKSEDLTRLNCLILTDLTFFDLRSLEKEQPYQIGDYYFQFCRRLKDEGDDTKTFAFYNDIGTFDTDTVTLTSGKGPINVRPVENEGEDAPRHLYYEMGGGEECTADRNKQYSMRYEIKCDPNVEVLQLGPGNLDLVSDPCAPKLTFSHKSGCPKFEATSIVRYLSDNPWALGIILIVVGGLICFFGGKWFPWVLAGVTGSLVFLIIMVLASILGAFKALDKGKEASPGQITAAVLAFLAALGAGIFVGWFIKRIQRTGLCLLGAAAGFFVGFILYTFILIHIYEHVGFMIGVSLTFCLVLGLLAYKFDKHIIIYLTGFIGAYAFVRGISMFAGHYPNEIFLYQQIQNEAYDGIEWQFYLYCVAIIGTGVLGCYNQFRNGYHKHEDEYLDDGYTKVK